MLGIELKKFGVFKSALNLSTCRLKRSYRRPRHDANHGPVFSYFGNFGTRAKTHQQLLATKLLRTLAINGIFVCLENLISPPPAIKPVFSSSTSSVNVMHRAGMSLNFSGLKLIGVPDFGLGLALGREISLLGTIQL